MSREQVALVDRINEICKKENLSYYALSYRSTIPISTILNIVKGNSKNPGIFTILKICEGLGVTPMEFFDTEEFWISSRSEEN